MIDDCSKKSRFCYDLYSELKVLETFSKHGDKKKVRLILKKHGSVEKLLNESSLELKDFRRKLLQYSGAKVTIRLSMVLLSKMGTLFQEGEYIVNLVVRLCKIVLFKNVLPSVATE